MIGSIISGISSIVGGKMQSDANWKQTKAVLQNQLQWKAKDAEKAGISKLYGIGAPSVSYSPSNVGLGTGLQQAGQDFGRALDAQTSDKSRVDNFTRQIALAQLDGLKIDNQIKMAELASRTKLNNQPGQPPPVNMDNVTPHIPGQGNSTIKLEKKMAPVAGDMPHRSYGIGPEVDLVKTAKGYAPVPSQEIAESLESMPLGAAQWFIRNNIMPTFNNNYSSAPKHLDPGKDKEWVFNPILGDYVPVYIGRGRAALNEWRRNQR